MGNPHRQELRCVLPLQCDSVLQELCLTADGETARGAVSALLQAAALANTPNARNFAAAAVASAAEADGNKRCLTVLVGCPELLVQQSDRGAVQPRVHAGKAVGFFDLLSVRQTVGQSKVDCAGIEIFAYRSKHKQVLPASRQPACAWRRARHGAGSHNL